MAKIAPKSKPIKKAYKVVSTWQHGLPANEAALKRLRKNGSAIDSLVEGCKVTELDYGNRTVGLGGWPDRTGKVTLDAAVMKDTTQTGAVAFLQNVEHPIELARRVMDKTPHALLVGKGAEDFAKVEGMLLSKGKRLDKAQRAKVKEWKDSHKYKPKANIENHDTISMLVLDSQGNMAAGSTTSGLALKMHGRVGDSPIVGAGLYVERGIGGAVCTGLGEVVMRTVGAHSIVESMRHGIPP